MSKRKAEEEPGADSEEDDFDNDESEDEDEFDDHFGEDDDEKERFSLLSRLAGVTSSSSAANPSRKISIWLP